MSYTAADVKKLRDLTGAGMMECKKALDEAKGDFDKASQIVHERGLAKADKKADRETKEGYIASYVHMTGKTAAMVELLCETDFVGRNEEFRALAKDIALQVVAMSPETVEELLAQESLKYPGQTIEEMVKALSGKIGEKMMINRFIRYGLGE